eukprot:6190287-Pleurochrysis_carterae.AAC.1
MAPLSLQRFVRSRAKAVRKLTLAHLDKRERAEIQEWLRRSHMLDQGEKGGQRSEGMRLLPQSSDGSIEEEDGWMESRVASRLHRLVRDCDCGRSSVSAPFSTLGARLCGLPPLLLQAAPRRRADEPQRAALLQARGGAPEQASAAASAHN